eukprot:COSAG01_NODE_21103_length_918_cov_1.285714_1_plen_61_part_00
MAASGGVLYATPSKRACVGQRPPSCHLGRSSMSHPFGTRDQNFPCRRFSSINFEDGLEDR